MRRDTSSVPKPAWTGAVSAMGTPLSVQSSSSHGAPSRGSTRRRLVGAEQDGAERRLKRFEVGRQERIVGGAEAAQEKIPQSVLGGAGHSGWLTLDNATRWGGA